MTRIQNPPSKAGERAFIQASLCMPTGHCGQATAGGKSDFWSLGGASNALRKVCLDAANLGVSKLIKLIDKAVDFPIYTSSPAGGQLRQPFGLPPSAAIRTAGDRNWQASELPFVDCQVAAA